LGHAAVIAPPFMLLGVLSDTMNDGSKMDAMQYHFCTLAIHAADSICREDK
jgi:hypothetical protein